MTFVRQAKFYITKLPGSNSWLIIEPMMMYYDVTL